MFREKWNPSHLNLRDALRLFCDGLGEISNQRQFAETLLNTQRKSSTETPGISLVLEVSFVNQW
jgi:hypothetical protein